jgi:RNA polymerase sigma-70 factor (ECF subfamily)
MTVEVQPSPSFEQFFLLHRAFVGRSLRHLGIDAADVDDLTQDVFLVVNRRVRAEQTSLAIVGQAWLFAITRRVAANHRRGLRRRSAVLAALPACSATRDDQDAALVLESFLRTIDVDRRLVFVLMEVEGLTGVETAAALELNVNTVHARLRAARKRLERFMRSAERRERARALSIRMEAR